MPTVPLSPLFLCSQYSQVDLLEVLYVMINDFNFRYMRDQPRLGGGLVGMLQLIFTFPMFWGMVMNANEFETKEI